MSAWDLFRVIFVGKDFSPQTNANKTKKLNTKELKTDTNVVAVILQHMLEIGFQNIKEFIENDSNFS